MDAASAAGNSLVPWIRTSTNTRICLHHKSIRPIKRAFARNLSFCRGYTTSRRHYPCTWCENRDSRGSTHCREELHLFEHFTAVYPSRAKMHRSPLRHLRERVHVASYLPPGHFADVAQPLDLAPLGRCGRYRHPEYAQRLRGPRFGRGSRVDIHVLYTSAYAVVVSLPVVMTSGGMWFSGGMTKLSSSPSDSMRVHPDLHYTRVRSLWVWRCC